MIIYETKGRIAMISIIAAIDSKRGIGKNNDLLFRIPADFKRMQKLTKGHPIIMGRRTFESIGRVLPGRTNIVISRSPSMYHKLVYDTSQLVFAKSLEEAIETARKSLGSDEIFIFGGGQVFKEAIEKGLVDQMHLTIVEARLDSPPESPARRGDFGADTFFPDYSMFKIIKEETHSASVRQAQDKSSGQAGKSGQYKFKFLTLQK